MKQQAELAAHVAQRAAFRAELTPLQQVQCVVDAAQAWVNPVGLESWFLEGEFSSGNKKESRMEKGSCFPSIFF